MTNTFVSIKAQYIILLLQYHVAKTKQQQKISIH